MMWCYVQLNQSKDLVMKTVKYLHIKISDDGFFWTAGQWKFLMWKGKCIEELWEITDKTSAKITDWR